MARAEFIRPILDENPVTVQILGLCSALAVSRSLKPALIMAAAVVCVLAVSNVVLSLLRGVIPASIRLIIEVTVIATGVIVADEILRAYAPETAAVLSVFVGLIITNCIVLGRAEAHALSHGPVSSLADALGNGLGYSIVLLLVAAVRELLGAGSLLDVTILDASWYTPNELMLYAPSGFFLIALVIWGLHGLRGGDETDD